jgi:type IV secretory pathway VirB2 component (pilin)
MFRYVIYALALSLLLGLAEMAAAATTTGMPWEGPLTQLLNSLTGPVVRIAGAVAIVVFGLGLAFSEGGGLIRKALGIVLGLTIAFNAVSWGLTFFGFSGGLVV